MSDRFLPSITQLKRASEELPDPEIWPEEEYSVPVESSRQSDDNDNDSRKNRSSSSQSKYAITFRRIRYSSRQSGKTYRWIYEGRVMFRNNIKES